MLASISGNVSFNLCSSFPNIASYIWLHIVMALITACVIDGYRMAMISICACPDSVPAISGIVATCIIIMR